ncbi:MAG TPA: DUF4870 domain-containing protein [Ktedonobacteraceae bacterium]|nr:DUF4870 domain-containing protein [Ktedonobacteraceae bacterium]
MGQNPNQPYPGQYGQPGQPGQPPEGSYQGGYQQQGAYPPPNPGFQPPNTGYPPPNPGYQPPNPGYQQQGYQYQQPYGQQGPLYNTSHPNGATSINMDPNTAAGLAYLATWLTGLIFFLIEKQNRFVRFHAMQSILAFASFFVLEIVLSIFSGILAFSAIGCIFFPIVSLVWLAAFVTWIVCMINAFQGKYFKLPIIGDYAERFANSGTPGVR